MKKFIAYSVVFLVFFVASLLSALPVSLVLEHAPVPRELQIQGAQGTIWQGKASQVRWQRYNLGEVQWQFRASDLLRGAGALNVRFGRGSDWQVNGKGVVGYQLGTGAFAENVVASMPAERALREMRLPVPLNVTGQLDVNIKQMVYAAPWCASGEGSVAWTGSTVNSKMGSFAMDLDLQQVIADVQCQNSELTAKGEQDSPQVQAEFDATLTPQRQYTANAWFRPGGAFPAELSNYLGFLGQPDAEGKFRFSQTGRL